MAEKLTSSERKAQKRKDLIKNILIVFLVVMLLLTFFSGTIQNWSLPEVATAYVQSGQVSPQIRGSGAVSADDPYNVVVNETRKISSVAVKEGDEVKKDDVIYFLEDAESEELEKALKELKDLEFDYELALFTGKVSDATISKATRGQYSSVSEYQSILQGVNARLTAAQEADDAVAAKIAALNAEYGIGAPSEDETSGGISSAGADTSALDLAVAEKTAERGKLANELGALDTTAADYATKKAWYDQQILNLDNEIIDLNLQIERVKTAYAQTQTQLGQEYAARRAALDLEKAQTEAALKQVEEEREELVAGIQDDLTLAKTRSNLQQAREEVERLREKSVGATITAPVEGTVTKLNHVAGETTKPDEPVAVIQIAGKAMTTSFSVTTEQAKGLKAGDIADPQNSWYYNDFKAVLTSIKPDPSDPSGKRLLTFSIDSPEVQAGQTVNLKLGEAQRNYEMTVPNSAIREDNNGKFILIVEQRSSPLRNRYIAQRVNVDVVASDDTTSAITAAIEGYEYVITTATAPIKAGQEVRLSNAGN